MGFKILIGERNEVNGMILEEMSRKLGFANTVNTSSQELFLTSAASQEFNLMILDSHLGNSDGFALLNHVRQKKGPNQFTPAVFVSTEILANLTHQCEVSGALGVLSKPFTFEEFTEFVVNFLPINKVS